MSQPLSLDFVEQPVWTFQRFSPFSVLLFIVATALSFFAWQYYAQLQTEFEAVSASVEVVKPADEMTESIEPLTANELNNVRNTVADLSTPWGQLLSGLEAIRMKHVALLLLEPNKKKSLVTLTGQAKNVDAMLQYVEAVAALPMLTNVYLQNHMIEMNEPGSPVSFTLLANWQ